MSRWVLSVALLLGATGTHAQDASATEPLLDIDALVEQAPTEYRVRLETTKGIVVIAVNRGWAPIGADRFYNLVRHGFYDDVRFFRVLPNFVVQFGMSGDPKLTEIWQTARIKDDPVKQSNVPGTVSFAQTGLPNSRTTQVFINLRDNRRLDGMGFAPFGVVVEGLDVVTRLYDDYGDGPPNGRGPQQRKISEEGNAYLDAEFPHLDRILRASIVDAATSE